MVRTVIVSASIGLILLALGAAKAEYRYVPDDYGTIQEAILACQNGDVVIVEEGMYFELLNFLGKNITVTSEDPSDPKIVANTMIHGDDEGTVVTFESGETRAAVLTGFTIKGGTGTIDTTVPEAQGVFWGGGIYCLNSSPTIRKNLIVENHGPLVVEGEIGRLGYGGGIACVQSGALISENIFTGNSGYAGGAIAVYLGDATAENNVIYGNSAAVAGGALMLGGRLINNTIWGNDIDMPGFPGQGFAGNVYAAFNVAYGETLVSNNIICNATTGGGMCFEDSEGYAFSYNNVWGNSPGNYVQVNQMTGETAYDGQYDRTGSNGNISADPLVVDPTDYDFHLLVDSPCINAGDPVYVGETDETDFDGEPRINAVRVDIGADEFHGHMKPIADAGSDQHVDNPQLITLEASGSYFHDPCGTHMFFWSQISGEQVELSDWTAMNPTFTPESFGEYVFELVVDDGEFDSEADQVKIIVRNRPPIADAGPDQSANSIPPQVTLDGSASYDLGGEALTYRWQQVSGPSVEMSDPKVVDPNFMPVEKGIYVFELTVNDGVNDSEPDEVGIVIGNRPPVAEAGPLRYAAEDPVTLDGTKSFDRDGYGTLAYHWEQVSGPPMNIADEDTATPTISGFVQAGTVQRCVFELTASDGSLEGEPDSVEVVIVPHFGNRRLILMNQSFDPEKPTIVGFGGGNCNTGGGMSFPSPSDWYEKANFLTVAEYGKPYERWADVLIAYLSSVAPDYRQPIQTMGFSTGNMPAIDVANRMNTLYADARYAVNRVTFLDAACRSYTSHINKFLASSVDGEPCWIDNYYATAGGPKMGTLNIGFPSPAQHSTPVSWYSNSPTPGSWPNSDMYNGGITAGFYLSVAGPGKNLRLSDDPSAYHFQWDSGTNHIKFYSEGTAPGRLPQAVVLVGPDDEAFVDANGAVLSCETSANAIGYQLLLGSEPDVMNYIVSDTFDPPTGIVKTFPFERTYWTVKVRDAYGSTIFADPICIRAEAGAEPPIENLDTGQKYGSIQRAIDEAVDGDEIVVGTGPYQYQEDINLRGKNIVVRSLDPDDPKVVETTVISGSGQGAVVTFPSGYDQAGAIAGFTIRNGGMGIYCYEASPQILNCTVEDNVSHGIELHKSSDAAIDGCKIARNGGSGIHMVAYMIARKTYNNCPQITDSLIASNGDDGIHQGAPTIRNCTIAGNGGSAFRSSVYKSSTITNSIVYFNGKEPGAAQIATSRVSVTYSNVQGSRPGEGNIDADPLFVQIGQWTRGNDSSAEPVWIEGDYHLLAGSPCVDAGDPNLAPPTSETDLEGNPRIAGMAVDMGAYEMQTQASIAVSQSRFFFEAEVGSAGPEDQLLIIQNDGAGMLDWEATGDVNWLQVTPLSGTSTGHANNVWLKVKCGNLGAGTYSCKVTVSDSAAANSPQIIDVDLVVNANCFPDSPTYTEQYADYLAYVAAGADPDCWCASPHDGTHYQCDGDADGKANPYTANRVFAADLAMIIKNWKTTIETANPCADVDHKADSVFGYRVFTGDLDVLITNWKKTDEQLSGDCPRPDGQ